MAITGNQREDRVPTPAPKIPAVIAKPTAPAYNPLSSLGVKPLTPAPKPAAPKSTPKPASVPKPTPVKTDAQMAADAQKILDQLGAMSQRLDTLSTGDNKPKDDVVSDDPSLVYAKMQDDKARQDAFSLLKDVFSSYGLSELATEIEGYMREGIGTAQATIKLKQSQAYKDRFYGNELRLASGRNVIDEASYLDLENSYSETLKAYGLQDYFGAGVTAAERKNRQKAIANVIGNDISAVEFKDRVSTAVDRVKMADPATKNAFQQFYGIGESELAKYFLDPTKTLVALKEKATAAEIGGAAIGQGLAATATSAEDLARFGINREQAQVGYSTIAEELPTASKLGQIYSQEGITYGQTEAEQATFKGLASAKRKKEQLISRETAAFSGRSGLSNESLKNKIAGQF
jgi:hypothetical protein